MTSLGLCYQSTFIPNTTKPNGAPEVTGVHHFSTLGDLDQAPVGESSCCLSGGFHQGFPVLRRDMSRRLGGADTSARTPLVAQGHDGGFKAFLKGAGTLSATLLATEFYALPVLCPFLPPAKSAATRDADLFRKSVLFARALCHVLK